MLIKKGLLLAAVSLTMASRDVPTVAPGSRDGTRVVAPRGRQYTPWQKEFYLTKDEADYVRPGFNITVNSITIPADRRPVVDLFFADDLGQALDRLGQVTPGPLSTSFVIAWWDPANRYYTSYINKTETAAPPSTMVGATATQATSDSGGTYTDLALGHSTYKFGKALPPGFDQTKTTTLGIYATRNTTDIVGKNYYANVEYDFRPDGGTVTDIWDKIANTACNTCHNPLAAHGGSRQDVKLCVLCHNAGTTDADTGNTVDFRVMIHKIHRGSSLPSVVAGTPYQIIGFQQSVNDFSTVAFPQDIRNCATCHAAPASQAANWYSFPSRVACGACHDDVNFTTGTGHVGGPQADDSQCAGCHVISAPGVYDGIDAPIEAAHWVPYKSDQLHGLKMTILSVANASPGKKPVVTFQVADKNGVSLDPRPFDTLQFTMGGPTTDYGVLPISEDARAGTAFDGTTATYTFQSVIPASATGTWVITSDVELAVVITRPNALPPITDFTESPLNPIYYVAITDPQPVARREVVDLANCNKCHDRIGAHGGRRLNTQGCVVCHNPVNDDSSQRPAAQAPPESIAFQRMIHRIHSGTNLTQDFTIYGHGGRKVNFNGVRFPGDRRDCEKCHVPGAEDVSGTPSAGLLPTVTQRDRYTPMFPTAAACLGCHDREEAAAHAFSMTAPFGESCAACHGDGAEFSVAKVHAR
jgi:OmcA/MtrC family decaheme c-type cytochrome